MNNRKISQETNFFDYTGTPMWAINELITNNFTNFFDKNKYQEIQTKSSNINKYITHIDYYIRFPHDIRNYNELNSNIFSDFCQKYKRRIIRLNDILNKNKKVLFIRTQEQMNNRILFEQHKEKYAKNELEYIINFSNIIKSKYPNLDFKILYLSETNKQDYLQENNIVIIQHKIPIIFTNYEISFNKIFSDNIDFINLHL
jgi:hypothetical protein